MSKYTWTMLTLLTVLSVILGGCGVFRPTPSPTATPQASPTPGATDTPAPTATPRASATPAPTLTPSPTPTPLPPQPPRLLGRKPERGEEQLATAPLVLRFDQEMDTASLQQAFRIEPEVKGTLSWDNAKTVRFVPAAPGFARDAAYRVTVGVAAKSKQNLPLTQPIEFRFQTIGTLEVTDVFPQPGSSAVNTASPIRVIFNRPVVALTGVQGPGPVPEWLTISPAVKAKASWTNTSILSLELEERLLPGTKYSVAVREGLQDVAGAPLGKAFTWSFTTELPKVISVSPRHNGTHISPNTDVRVTFNQPMAQPATQELFSLTRGKGQPSLPGRFVWVANTLIFTPTEPLEMGAQYVARLRQGAPSATGDATIGQANEWQFRVAAVPQVTAFRPAEGESNARLDQPLRIAFSGPVSTPTLLKRLVISPTAEPYIWWESSDTIAYVSLRLRPSTDYVITVTRDVLGRYGQPLAAPATVRFRTRPYDPLLSLLVPDRIGSYNAYAKPKVYLNHRNVTKANLKLYTVGVEELVALTRQDSWSAWSKFQPKAGNLLRSWTADAAAPLNATGTISISLTRADGAALAPGLYYLEATAPESGGVQRHLIVLSNTNLVLKSSQQSALVWATDLRDGLPVPGVRLTLYDANGQRAGEAETDNDGIAQMPFPKQEPWEPVTVVGSRGDGLCVVVRGWSNGIEPWDFGLNMAPYAEKYRGYLYTERRMYRPNQKVYFKGILRADDDGRYSIPPTGSEVLVTASDDMGREVYSKALKTGDMGTFDGEIELGADASLGYYSLQANLDGQVFGTDFRVAEYRKPEFQAQVTMDKADYLPSDKVQVLVEASYFFGGPVSGAQVQWRVMTRPYYFDRWQGKGYYDFTDYDDEYLPSEGPFGEPLTEGSAVTDAQGRLVVALPADIGKRKQSQIYTFEASIVDLNNQEVSARSEAVLHRGDFYIGLAPASYVGNVGREQTVKIITVDTQGMTVTNQALEVVFYKHEWYSVREKAEDGSFHWTSKVRDTAVATQTVTTDGLGQAMALFTPEKGGVYRARATGRDRSENEVRSSTYLWVSSSDYVPWRQENNDRIELVTDKKSYKPGETAQILVPSPYQGTTVALMTFERGGILERRIIKLTSNSERLDVPILPEYAPNVYVGLVIIKGMDKTNPVPGFKVGYAMLTVSTERQELTISITPDRTTPYKPRDKATYQIRATDYQGQGVEAELALQLVDLAVESLTGADTRSILQEFYQQRGLGVSTAATLAVSVDRQNLERAAAAKGGGGGGDGEMVRTNLPDTAFWAPAVRTDSEGKAQVTVQLPDNLTTWRMSTQAVTMRTEVGKAKADIVTSLEVMVRPVIPRFLTIGDKPILGAVVHNNTNGSLDLDVQLQAQGIALQNAKQRVTVPAGGRTAVSWPAEVGAIEETTLRFSAAGGGRSDAIELKLPVYHPSTPETVGTAGEVEERIIELVRLPEQLDPTLGELTVLLEPSLAAGMRAGLDYLKAYPYDCIEQTISRFLPNVFTYRALREMKVQRADLEQELPKQVGNGLQRLYTLQNPDGGWGWWGREESSPWLTAYAVLGLAEARRADFSVDADVVERAVGFLLEFLAQLPNDATTRRTDRAAVLYALAEVGRGDLGRTVALYDQRDGMPLYAKAYLAMALHILQPEETTRLASLVTELGNAAILSATGTHWEEKSRDWWAMNSDIRSTAIILRALVRLQPKSKLLPSVVRWLMLSRNAGRWESTQENAWCILAITDYAAASGEFSADYAYNLMVNGASLARGQMTPDKVDQTIRTQTAIGALRRDQDNDVVIDRVGPSGKLYYSAFLRYFVPAEKITALNRGIIVERQYFRDKKMKVPATEAKVNDTIYVKLTIVAPHNLYHVVVEDALPAGCEAIDTSLVTSSQVGQEPELQRQDEEDWYDPWRWYWPTHTELRDEKVALFATYLGAGTYEYRYSMRCTTPGVFQVNPALAYEMYFADVFGRSSGGRFVIAGQ